MSAFRVKDTELWLRAKLEDPWAGENISALLTPDILEEIAANFNSYEPQVKAKLLISIINIKRSALKGLEEKLKAIFNSASQDKDEWVKVVYHITKTYIKNFTLNTHDFETCGNALELSYKECASALRNSKVNCYPQYACYLNERVSKELFSQEAADIVVNIKSRPKSDKLATEIREICCKAALAENFNSVLSSTSKQEKNMKVPALGFKKSAFFNDPSDRRSHPSSVHRKISFGTRLPLHSSVNGIEIGKSYNQQRRGMVYMGVEESGLVEQKQIKRKKTDAELAVLEEEKLVKKKLKEEEKEKKKQEKLEKALERKKSLALKKQRRAASNTEPPPPSAREDKPSTSPLQDARQNMSSELPSQERQENDGELSDLKEKSKPLLKGTKAKKEIKQTNKSLEEESVRLKKAKKKARRERKKEWKKHNPLPSDHVQPSSASNKERDLDLQKLPAFHQQKIKTTEHVVEPALMGPFRVPIPPAPCSQEPAFLAREQPPNFYNGESTRHPQAPPYGAPRSSFYPYLTGVPPSPTPLGGPSASPLLYDRLQQPGYMDTHPYVKLLRRVEQEHAQTFQLTNCLTDVDRITIARFIDGDRENPNPAIFSNVHHILMNEEYVKNSNGEDTIEQIIFEMNYEFKSWKRLKRSGVVKMTG